MSYADDVRQYCTSNIVAPARRRGEKQVSIRAGDVHSAMRYANRMPLVCAALGATKFETLAAVERLSLTGPTNGANAIFTFLIK